MEPYPIMRPTSSTRSSLIEISRVARQLGTVTERTRGDSLAHAELQALEDAGHLFQLHGAAQLSNQPIHGQKDGRRAPPVPSSCRPHRPRAGCRARPLRTTRARGPDRARCCAGPGLSRSAWRRPCAACGARRSCGPRRPGNRRISSTILRVLCADPGIEPADDAGDGDRPALVGDHDVAGIESVLFLIQRHDALAFPGRAHDDGGAAQEIAVEGVHAAARVRP